VQRTVNLCKKIEPIGDIRQVQRTGNIAVRGTAPTRSGLFLQRLGGSAVFNAFNLKIQ
jgi:hypothetical protein